MDLRVGLTVVLLAAALPVAAQREAVAAGSVREAPDVQRDTALERSVSSRARSLDPWLRPSARSKVALAAQSVLAHIAYGPGEPDPHASARREVRSRFGQLNEPEADLACFLVLAEVLRCLANPAALSRQLDVSTLSEERSLRLSMAMDRRSKLIETLGELMEKLTATESAVVGNLK